MLNVNVQPYISYVVSANQRLKSSIQQSGLSIRYEAPDRMGDINGALRSFFRAMHHLGFTERNLHKRKAVLVFIAHSNDWNDPIRFDGKIEQAYDQVMRPGGVLVRVNEKQERELRLGRLNILKFSVLSGLGLLEDPIIEKRMLEELAAGGVDLGLVIA